MAGETSKSNPSLLIIGVVTFIVAAFFIGNVVACVPPLVLQSLTPNIYTHTLAAVGQRVSRPTFGNFRIQSLRASEDHSNQNLCVWMGCCVSFVRSRLSP